jgi:alkanesulfonate monooxygenase SsuD/methylene tetrahydromethanopterin reductase-like flavin-dependent oxidoreductase (luciferase family)
VTKHALFLPIFDALADPRLLGDLAAEAEAAGWYGVFVWDHLQYRPPIRAATDPWTAMACIAMQTTRVRLGPMVTPLARRRPQVLARQVAALDQLSGGRFVLGVGLGLDASGAELSSFGEELDDRRRAAMLDEALTVVRGLLSGERVDHDGPTYAARGVTFLPAAPVPVWVAARWPNRRPLLRAAAHDGLFVIDVAAPADLRAALDVIEAERGTLDAYDVAVFLREGESADAWSAAGATWLLTDIDPFTVTIEQVRARIATRG